MPNYSVVFARSARKELEKLPLADARRIISKIEDLILLPRPPGAVTLQGNKGLWRIRIGEYRVVYSIDEAKHIVDISAIGNRRDVYRDF